MNDERRGEDELTPAEERLLALLLLLRTEPPRSDPGLTDAVVRTARWQLVLRGVLRTMGGFAAAAGDALAAVLALRTERRRGE